MGTLTPVLLGGLLAIIGSVILQLLIVPRVDAVRRQRERWESTLATVGETLAFVDVELTESIKSALMGVLGARDVTGASREYLDGIDKALSEDGPDADKHPWLVKLADAHREVDHAYERHHRHMTQLAWLKAKLEADAPRDRDLAALRSAHEVFCGASVQLRDAYGLELTEVTTLGEAGYDTYALHILWYFTELAKARGGLTLEVKRLLVAGRSLEPEFLDPYRDALERIGLDPDDPTLVAPEDRESVGPFESSLDDVPDTSSDPQ